MPASIELEYASGMRDRVGELVRREAACCAFLDFVVEEVAGRMRLTITVPHRARDLAGELLAPFRPAR